MRYELSGGNWMELRDVATLTEGQRRPVRSKLLDISPATRAAMESSKPAVPTDGRPAVPTVPAAVADVLTGADMDTLSQVNDMVAVSMIETWSFGEEISTDALLSLPGKVYDEILMLVAPALTAFMGVDFDVTPDRASPTQPSNA